MSGVQEVYISVVHFSVFLFPPFGCTKDLGIFSTTPPEQRFLGVFCFRRLGGLDLPLLHRLL